MPDLMRKETFSYAFDASKCDECAGKCCTGESGNIFVNSTEIEKISEHLNLSNENFVKDYLRKVGYKYSIKEVKKEDSYECLFFDEINKNCSIYEARPTQCKTFPFWDYYKSRVGELKEECIGVIDD